MSPNEVVPHDLSEDNGNADDRMVPVSQAIRYRKRAQQAEKQLVELTDELGR